MLFGLQLFPSKREIFALGECFHKGRDSQGGDSGFRSFLLVVLSHLPLSGGTSFDFSFCADLML